MLLEGVKVMLRWIFCVPKGCLWSAFRSPCYVMLPNGWYFSKGSTAAAIRWL